VSFRRDNSREILFLLRRGISFFFFFGFVYVVLQTLQ
jgi:hypothetical protein